MLTLVLLFAVVVLMDFANESDFTAAIRQGPAEQPKAAQTKETCFINDVWRALQPFSPYPQGLFVCNQSTQPSTKEIPCGNAGFLSRALLSICRRRLHRRYIVC